MSSDAADLAAEAKRQEKLAKKAETEAIRKAKEAQMKADKLARKAERQAANALKQEEATRMKARKAAQKQYAHWMRCLKRDVDQKDLDKLSVEEMARRTPALKMEFEENVKKAKEAKELQKIANNKKSQENAAEAAERRDRSIAYTLDSDAFLAAVKEMCAKHGEVDSCKFVVTGGVGRMPGIQVRYKNPASAKKALAAKVGPMPCPISSRPAPSPSRAISFVLAPSVITQGGVAAAREALKAAKVKGITMVSTSKGQITVEFATEKDAEVAMKIVNNGLKVGGKPLVRGAERGLARKLTQDEGANKKRKMEE